MTKPPRTAYPYRRLLQFRLRTLLVVFLLAPAGVGLWQIKSREYRAQQAALAALADHKPYVTFQPGRPEWLGRFIGEKVFQDVVHLSLQGRREFSDKDAVHLAALSRLRRLSLQNTGISDEGLRYLSKLSELDTLSLDDTYVSDEGLQHLRGLRKLRVLQAGDLHLSGRGLAHLADLPLLVRVEAANLGTRDADMHAIAQLTQVRELQVWVAKLSDAGFRDLSSMKRLERLELLGSSIPSGTIDAMPNLRSLQIGVWRCEDLTLRDLPRLTELDVQPTGLGRLRLESLPKLQEVDLSRKRVLPETLASVAGLPNLRTLRLNGAKLKSGAWPQLAKIDGLRVLDLSHTEMDIEKMPLLAGMASLEELSLAGNDLSTRALPYLSELSRLRVLDLHDVALFDNSLVHSAARGNLRRSELFGPLLVPDNGFRSLLKLANLERLSLKGTGVLPPEVLLLRELPKLQKLALDQRAWTDSERRRLRDELGAIAITNAVRIVGTDELGSSSPGARTPLRGMQTVGNWKGVE